MTLLRMGTPDTVLAAQRCFAFFPTDDVKAAGPMTAGALSPNGAASSQDITFRERLKSYENPAGDRWGMRMVGDHHGVLRPERARCRSVGLLSAERRHCRGPGIIARA